MVDAWLVIVMIVVPIVLTVGNFYFLIYYGSKDELKFEWHFKIVLLIALLISEVTVLLLPLDVANRGPPAAGLPMGTIWIVFYALIGILAVIVLPFCSFYYESEEVEDEENTFAKRLRRTIIMDVIVLLVFIAIYAVLYIFFGVTEIATQKLTSGILAPGDAAPAVGCFGEGCGAHQGYMRMRVSLLLFLVTVIDVVGYLFMVVFGGIGLVALPFGLIQDWAQRPRRISKQQFEEGKKKIGRKAVELYEVGETIKEGRRDRKRRAKLRDKYNRWCQAVELLKSDYENLKQAYEFHGAKLILAWAKLPLGILAAIGSLLWVLHIILYIVVPGHKILFLNNMFIAMFDAWGLIGTIAYGIFAFYLLLCVINGVVSFGMRFFFFFPVHPMKVGGTLMNSFLFNAILILISAITVTHFCADAFQDFARNTAATQIFSYSIGSLRILKYWFKYSVFGFLIIPILTGIYLAIKPKAKDETEFLTRLNSDDY